jgi:hypothetical protein
MSRTVTGSIETWRLQSNVLGSIDQGSNKIQEQWRTVANSDQNSDELS